MSANHPGYRVTGALVIAADPTDKLHHRYQGAWIPWLNDVQRAHFLRHGLVEELQAAPAAPAPAAPPKAAGNLPDKPAKTATKEQWVEYGVALGNDHAELEALTKQELVDLLG